MLMQESKFREKTPQERLELRSYDSYPFNQKLSDFFEDKEKEINEMKQELFNTEEEVQKLYNFINNKNDIISGLNEKANTIPILKEKI